MKTPVLRKEIVFKTQIYKDSSFKRYVKCDYFYTYLLENDPLSFLKAISVLDPKH